MERQARSRALRLYGCGLASLEREDLKAQLDSVATLLGINGSPPIEFARTRNRDVPGWTAEGEKPIEGFSRAPSCHRRTGDQRRE